MTRRYVTALREARARTRSTFHRPVNCARFRTEGIAVTIQDDARQFGQHFEGGWQLGLLVARSVYKRSQAGRPAKSEPVRNKVSCAKFAKMAGVSERTVQFYCDTWALAAEAGHCTPADELSPGADDPKLVGIDLASYEFRELWNKCYHEVRQRRAKNGNAESGTKRQHRKGSTSESQNNGRASAESGSSHADGNADATGCDPKAHPLYGLQQAINELHDALKRRSPNTLVVAAAAKVANKQHRAALARVTGAL